MLIPVNAISATELKSAIIYDPLLATTDTTVGEAIVQMSGIAAVPAVCSIPQTANNYDHLKHLLPNCSSCVLIVENNRPVGIFTEQNVVRVSTQTDLENLTLCDVISHPVITLQESKFTDLFFALNLFQHHRIRHLPLVDEENQLVGLLTYESLRQILRTVDLLRLRLVHEVMTTNILCADANVSILEIARLMAENQVSAVMIVETQASLTIPLGMVTERDLVQLKALKVNFETCLAETVMSTPVFCVTVDESLWTVQQIMEQQFIQCLAVTGSKGELVGMVTHNSILQAFNQWELYKLTAVLQEKVLQLETEKIQLLENRTLELEKQIEERTIKLKRKAEQEELINQIATQIHSSLDLQEILNQTVIGIQLLLKCDRVIIYKFSGDFCGQVIAEAIITGHSVINQKVYDTCVSLEWLELYRQGQIRVINDINTESITECHQQMLKGLDIRAKILSPLVVENQLWGLMLASYRDIPHNWEPEEIELIKQMSLRVAIAIQQANIYQQTQIEIHQRQQAEELIKQQLLELKVFKTRYELVSTASGQIMYEYNWPNDTPVWTTNMEEILGYSYSELPRNLAEFLEIVHPEDRDRLYSLIQKNLAHKSPVSTEYRLRRKDGSYIWVADRNQLVLDDQGEIVFVAGSILDITGSKNSEEKLSKLLRTELIIRKEAEAEIYLQLQRQKAIQDITQEIRSSLNLNNILTTITAKVQELTQADRVIIFRLFPDGKSKIVEESVSSGYKAFKDSYWEDEKWSPDVLEYYWQGKPRIVVDVMNDIWTDCLRDYSQQGDIKSKIVAPILQDLGENENGRWVNHPHNKLWGVLVVHACSQKRIWEESEAELLQQIANQLAIAIQQADLFDKLQKSLAQEKEISTMRARFISMVSHEFRTPLAIISSSTGILQTFSDRLSAEKKQGHLETIQKTIKYTVQLLDDVLMINSVETEKIEFKPQRLNIIDFCRRLIREIQGTSYSHVIEFSLNSNELILDDTFLTEFDTKIIRQILTNLLTNGIKYSPESSTINFSLNITPQQIIFIVQDYGIGIPKEDQVNLFGSFYRGSNVGNISGTGLGLAIVKKCVDQHQGKITLESKLNQGTIFKVSIPRYDLIDNG
ncbi:MAG: GAF domain-containing protein [Dolichospermum sp.]